MYFRRRSWDVSQEKRRIPGAWILKATYKEYNRIAA
jgi:hypothetical protein